MEEFVTTTEPTSVIAGVGELIVTVAQVIRDFGAVGVLAIAIVAWFVAGRPPIIPILRAIFQGPNNNQGRRSGESGGDGVDGFEGGDVEVMQGAHGMVSAEGMVSQEELKTVMDRWEKSNDRAHRDMFKEVRGVKETMMAEFEKTRAQIAASREENRKMLNEHAEDDEKEFKEIREKFGAQERFFGRIEQALNLKGGMR